MTLHKIIAEPMGATQILCKPHKYEHKANSKNSISRFGKEDKNASEKWATLVKNRYKELVSGKVQSVSWDKMKQNILG